MDLLSANPPLSLEDNELKLRTAGAITPAARIGAQASVRDSLISPASHIDGEVLRSVISPACWIEPGAVVRDSIIQHKCVIRAGAVIERSILDKEVTVGRGVVIGAGDDAPTSSARGHRQRRHYRHRQARHHPLGDECRQERGHRPRRQRRAARLPRPRKWRDRPPHQHAAAPLRRR